MPWQHYISLARGFAVTCKSSGSIWWNCTSEGWMCTAPYYHVWELWCILHTTHQLPCGFWKSGCIVYAMYQPPYHSWKSGFIVYTTSWLPYHSAITVNFTSSTMVSFQRWSAPSIFRSCSGCTWYHHQVQSLSQHGWHHEYYGECRGTKLEVCVRGLWYWQKCCGSIGWCDAKG